MNEIEAFLTAFGAPVGIALWILWQWIKQGKSSDGGGGITAQLKELRVELADVRDRLARMEGYMEAKK